MQKMIAGHAALHVAIIMDGNGRWARARGRPRTAGHAEGARAVRAVVEAAASSPLVGMLTLYAFSSDNWGRSRGEVRGLMRLLAEYLRKETPRCVENGIRLEVIGRRDRLPAGLAGRIRAAEEATRSCGPAPALVLRLAIDYSARDLLARAAELAAERAVERAVDREAFRRLLAVAESGVEPADGVRPGAADEARGPAPDVDLLVRTGGERRLSDFLLWECAYAELVFTSTLWPDFGAAELEAALAEYGRRERRFGRVLEEAS